MNRGVGGDNVFAETFDWERYSRWNSAIARVVYAGTNAGQPVYLDAEDDVLDAIRDLAEPEATSARAGLVQAVGDVLLLNEGPAAMLRGLLERLERWEQGDLEDPPPTLGLLAVMSLAAENMRDGGGKAANNFYGRLAELLDLDGEQSKRFMRAYWRSFNGRPTSDVLWGSLNLWLELHEGNRGLVTAYANRQAHIGLPMSQALVRQVDREKFRSMFALYGLAPHSSLPPVEMAEVISDWMSHVPCPASNQLERLWKGDDEMRARIVGVAQLTLEAWDGTAAEVVGARGGAARRRDAVRFRATIGTFPRKQLVLTLVMPASPSDEGESLGVVDAEGAVLSDLDVVPVASGWTGLADPSEIDTGSFLSGVTRLRRARTSDDLCRRPRRVVPLRYDHLLNGYLECERLNLGEDSLLIVHADAAPGTERVLKASARVGYTRYDELAGLPEGWVLFDGVQILAPVPAELVQHLDLNPLQPLSSSQAALHGGSTLPGNIRKWSSFGAPELRVSVDEGSSVAATVASVRPLTSPAPEPTSRTTDEPVLIWDLSDLHLPDGDYEVAITVDGSSTGRPLVMRLRSADHPALLVAGDEGPLVHDPDEPGFGLLASRSRGARAFWVAADGRHPLQDVGAETVVPGWVEARQSAASPYRVSTAVSIPGPQSGSCMLTGAHLMQIETVYPGRTASKLMAGVCSHCGIVKRYPTRGRRKRHRKPRESAGPQFDPAVIAPVRARAEVDWRVGLDSLSHLQLGPISSLDRIAAQVDSTGLFADTFTRRLEVLGHIEVKRHSRSVAPTAWSVNPPTLVGLTDDRNVLTGFRSETLLAAVEDHAYAAGLGFEVDSQIDGPPLVTIEATAAAVPDLLRAMDAATGHPARHIRDAAARLAAVLPPLSGALRGLPTTAVVSSRSIEHWDPVTARFVASTGTRAPGAYRLKGLTRTYIYRRAEDLEAMTALVGDARITKFAAALETDLPLVGYDADAQILYVPLGADLPGLYGRAAVLASGRPPVEDERRRILQYTGVPPGVASRLQTALAS
jgi:hypothetical protein